MAKMIPQFGAAPTDSRSEPLVYGMLRDGLSNEFTVIHSLPWLCAATNEIDESFVAPTGEIDFLVLHPTLGILAIEVKGGRYKIEGAAFVLLHSGERVDAVRQTRRNTHGLARWLAGKSVIHYRIGYALCFPDSHFEPSQLPPGLVDPSGTTLKPITLTFGDMPCLAARIKDVMSYWHGVLRTRPLGEDKINEICDALCPGFDGSPEWGQRVLFDNHFWLRLTAEQSSVVNKVLASDRSIITGWPGTGKTLIGIEVGRRLKGLGIRVAVVTYNSMLANYLSKQIGDSNCDVFTWHKLCSKARTFVGLPSPGSDNDWFQDECATDLQSAIKKGVLGTYDALILDEAQALRPEWCSLLVNWFSGKKIVALCDETQVFSFEKERTTLAALSGILGGVQPFHLTIVMRMPRAVTDRLIEVLPSPLQLTSPREFDAATVRELVVGDFETCLTVITDELFSSGIHVDEIVVLSKYSNLTLEVDHFVQKHPGICQITVSRFRGMEAPVVIVVSADEFSDQELFCAYSRATTLCFVLFSASGLLQPKEGGFLPGVVGKSENREIIEKLRYQSHTGTLLRGHPQRSIEGICSVSISWSKEWMCWLVQCARASPMMLWVDFLATSYTWPVLFWHEDSQNSAGLVQRNLDEYSASIARVDIKFCQECDQNTPWVYAPTTCCVCAGLLSANASVLTHGHVRRLVEHDENIEIIMTAPAEELLQRIKGIPMLLGIAVLGQRAARLHPLRDVIPDQDYSSTSDLYRWACVLVKSLILLRPAGSEMSVAEMAAETYHPDLPNYNISHSTWHGKIASSFNLYYKHGLLSRIAKGRYLSRCN